MAKPFLGSAKYRKDIARALTAAAPALVAAGRGRPDDRAIRRAWARAFVKWGGWGSNPRPADYESRPQATASGQLTCANSQRLLNTRVDWARIRHDQACPRCQRLIASAIFGTSTRKVTQTSE